MEGFGGSVFWVCQGGCECERRIEVIVKIQKKSGEGVRSVGCERRIEVFVKMQKKLGGQVVESKGGCK